LKNLIVFIPLLTSQNLLDGTKVTAAWWAFVAFSLCASAAYVLNELLDLESDRQRPRQQLRPFASGEIPLAVGLSLVVVLFAMGVALGFMLGWRVAAVVGAYFVLSTIYSRQWNTVALVDVLCLTGLYTLRLVAGHEATGVRYSIWLLVFSLVILTVLALVERFARPREN
jgi:4-hydroxybenzoate polyprenyltransferase